MRTHRLHFPILFTHSIIFGVVTTAHLVDHPEIRSPCGADLGDCPSLTCIPLSTNCTVFDRCSGTCQDLTATEQQIYTLCGGWEMMDDCDERVEQCIADPRSSDGCGPSCDGPGICAPTKDVCGEDTGKECDEGKACFPRVCFTDKTGERGTACGGLCFPLRFGSDSYEKSGLVEVVRHDQDGDQSEGGV